MHSDDHADLRRMARQFRELGIPGAFARVHHFSSSRFASKPSTLRDFVAYCEGVDDFQYGENPQTIRRGLAVCDSVRQGHPLADAIAAAWRSFPLVTR